MPGTLRKKSGKGCRLALWWLWGWLWLPAGVLWASPLAPEQLAQELAALEQIPTPDVAFRERVSLLAREWLLHPAPDQARIRRLMCWASPKDRVSDYLAAIAQADQALAWTMGERDWLTRSELLSCRGWFYQQQGEMDLARQDYDAALDLAHQHKGARETALALFYRGAMGAFQGKMGDGLKDLLLAHRLYDELGLTARASQARLHIAEIYQEMGQFDEARYHLDRLRERFEERHEWERVADIDHHLGLLALDAHDYQGALAALSRAAQFYRQQGMALELAIVEVGLAEVLLNQQRHDEALALLQQAGLVLRADVDPLQFARWQLVMAEVHLARGELAIALTLLADLEPAFRHEQSLRFLARLLYLKASALEQHGDPAGALEALHRHLKVVRTLDHRIHEQSLTWMRGEFELAQQQAENDRLKASQQHQQQELDQLKERRLWQSLALSLGLLAGGLLLIWLLDHNRHVRRLAFTDELTGIDNRRHVLHQGARMLVHARRSGRPLCVLLLDIDHFKRINDTLGHHQGDRVLRWTVDCLRLLLRRHDSLGRTGGEEFLILLPDTRLGEALKIGERVCDFLGSRTFPGMGWLVTVSIGCAELRANDGDLSALIQRADAALYRAKANGRNRVEQAD